MSRQVSSPDPQGAGEPPPNGGGRGNPASQLKALLRSARQADSGSRRVVSSVAWIVGGQMITLTLTFIVSVVVANYLGVAKFGQLAYVLSIVTLLSALATAGLNSVVVRDIVRSRDDTGEILGTAMAVRIATGSVVYVLLVASTFLFSWGPSDQLVMAAVGSLLVLQALEVTGFWFQSETQMRYVIMARLAETVAGGGARIAVVAVGGSLLGIALGYGLEALVAGVVLIVLYRRLERTVGRWRVSWRRAKSLLRQAVPLTLGAAASNVNLRIDQILLGLMLGNAAVGTYAVAARLSEVWYFVPNAVSIAVFPGVIRAKEKDAALYRERMELLYGLAFWGAVLVAIAVSLISGPLIDLLYSAQFSGAAAVLRIHIWSAPFLFMSILFNRWLVAEGLLYQSLTRQSLAAALNVGLNVILIPRYGPSGSAFATLISYAFATYGMSFLSKKTLPAAEEMTRGITLPFRVAGAVVSKRLSAGNAG